MNRLILEKNENTINYRIYEETRFGKIEKSAKAEEVNLFINYINRVPKSISSFRINKENITFRVNDMLITMVNYQNFSNDKRFSSIFKKVRNKNFKLLNRNILTGTLIAVSLLGTLKGIDSIKKTDNIIYDKPDYSTSTEENNYIYDNSSNEHKEVSAVTQESESKYVDDELIIEQEKNEIQDEEKNINSGSNYDEKMAKTRELYYDKIEKYANMYGLDPDVICAIATQERGVHSSIVDPGGAIGLMQIQVEVWDNQDVCAYNYDTNSNEKVHITLNDLRDASFNIKVGCMIFQNYLNEMDKNLTAAIQCYNMGPGSVNSMINKYCKANNLTRMELLNSNDNGWLNYRNSSYPGDPKYVEHVTRYIDREKSPIIM